MNYIFAFFIISSIIIGAITGKLEDVMTAMLTSSKTAVEIGISLLGIMAFWMGVVKIAQKSGLIKLFAKLISPVLRLIFNELPKNSPAFSNIALNISANAMGLMNAATPFGIKAMQDLKKEGGNKDIATNSMCIFLGMNTAGLQLVPAAIIGILIANGSKNPTDIIIPTFIVTFSAWIFAILIAKFFAKIWRERLE